MSMRKLREPRIKAIRMEKNIRLMNRKIRKSVVYSSFSSFFKGSKVYVKVFLRNSSFLITYSQEVPSILAEVYSAKTPNFFE